MMNMFRVQNAFQRRMSKWVVKMLVSKNKTAFGREALIAFTRSCVEQSTLADGPRKASRPIGLRPGGGFGKGLGTIRSERGCFSSMKRLVTVMFGFFGPLGIQSLLLRHNPVLQVRAGLSGQPYLPEDFAVNFTWTFFFTGFRASKSTAFPELVVNSTSTGTLTFLCASNSTVFPCTSLGVV